jgi:enoyl-CoA hydratase/3-hydroxyacyl-CoA dehydrogenase
VSAEGTLDPLVERLRLRALVEACLVVEEGVANVREVDAGLMGAAGMKPGPFAWADQHGLHRVLERLRDAEGRWGEAFRPPLLLQRLVAQGRLGTDAGQGFYPYPRTDEGWPAGDVLLETRGPVAVAWLSRPPANPLSPGLVDELTALWDAVDGTARGLVIASTTPSVFSAGADIRGLTSMDAETGAGFIDDVQTLLRRMERSSTATIAAVNGLALGGGCELAMACDVRIAAEGASFGQPEISLGIIPGFGGTQRLPRIVGSARALELCLAGTPISAYEALRIGLVNRVVPDHELFDTALNWANGLAERAPVAVRETKRAFDPDLETGLDLERERFAAAFASDDAAEGIAAFLEKRRPRFTGR